MRSATCSCILILIGVGMASHAAPEGPDRRGSSRQPVQTSTCNDVPPHAFDLILGRPTSNSITVSALCYADTEACIAYGTQPGSLGVTTPARPFRKGEPTEIVLSPLLPNTRYYYQFRSALTNSGELTFLTAARQRLHVHRHGRFPPGSEYRSGALSAHARQCSR